MNSNVNYGNILATLQPHVKKLLRKYEHTTKRLIKAEFALKFNSHCINEKYLPIYTNIKTHDPAARGKAFTKEFRLKLITNQVEAKRDAVSKLRMSIMAIY